MFNYQILDGMGVSSTIKDYDKRQQTILFDVLVGYVKKETCITVQSRSPEKDIVTPIQVNSKKIALKRNKGLLRYYM